MMKEFTCIICPRGCIIEIDTGEGLAMEKSRAEGGAGFEPTLERALASAAGMGCRRGADYVRQEIVNPMRTIATSAKVLGGTMQLVSVRTTKAIPKSLIRKVLSQAQALVLAAPVEAGRILIAGVAGSESDIIATSSVPKANEPQD